MTTLEPWPTPPSIEGDSSRAVARPTPEAVQRHSRSALGALKSNEGDIIFDALCVIVAVVDDETARTAILKDSPFLLNLGQLLAGVLHTHGDSLLVSRSVFYILRQFVSSLTPKRLSRVLSSFVKAGGTRGLIGALKVNIEEAILTGNVMQVLTAMVSKHAKVSAAFRLEGGFSVLVKSLEVHCAVEKGKESADQEVVETWNSKDLGLYRNLASRSFGRVFQLGLSCPSGIFDSPVPPYPDERGKNTAISIFSAIGIIAKSGNSAAAMTKSKFIRILTKSLERQMDDGERTHACLRAMLLILRNTPKQASEDLLSVKAVPVILSAAEVHKEGQKILKAALLLLKSIRGLSLAALTDEKTVIGSEKLNHGSLDIIYDLMGKYRDQFDILKLAGGLLWRLRRDGLPRAVGLPLPSSVAFNTHDVLHTDDGLSLLDAFASSRKRTIEEQRSESAPAIRPAISPVSELENESVGEGETEENESPFTERENAYICSNPFGLVFPHVPVLGDDGRPLWIMSEQSDRKRIPVKKTSIDNFTPPKYVRRYETNLEAIKRNTMLEWKFPELSSSDEAVKAPAGMGTRFYVHPQRTQEVIDTDNMVFTAKNFVQTSPFDVADSRPRNRAPGWGYPRAMPVDLSKEKTAEMVEGFFDFQDPPLQDDHDDLSDCEPLYEQPRSLVFEMMLHDLESLKGTRRIHNPGNIVFDAEWAEQDFKARESWHEDDSTNEDLPRIRVEEEEQDSDGQRVPPLRFESRFESGNLRRAVRSGIAEYELILNSDINTMRHVQWFCYAVAGAIPGVKYKFNTINLEKPNSQFNSGMQPLLFSQKTGKWTRAGENVCYYPNQYPKTTAVPAKEKETENSKRPSSAKEPLSRSKSSKKDRGAEQPTYFTLTYTIQFPDDVSPSDVFCIAFHYPYTYSSLQRYLAGLDSNEKLRDRYHRQLLCHTLSGNRCDLLTITDFGSNLPGTKPPEPVVPDVEEEEEGEEEEEIVIDNTGVKYADDMSDIVEEGKKEKVVPSTKEIVRNVEIDVEIHSSIPVVKHSFDSIPANSGLGIDHFGPIDFQLSGQNPKNEQRSHNTTIPRLVLKKKTVTSVDVNNSAPAPEFVITGLGVKSHTGTKEVISDHQEEAPIPVSWSDNSMKRGPVVFRSTEEKGNEKEEERVLHSKSEEIAENPVEKLKEKKKAVQKEEVEVEDPDQYKEFAKGVVVLSARVHPGETNSSWIMKGIIDFLISDHPIAETLRKRLVFKIIPMLNPDGVINGNHRTNMTGLDMNREWQEPSVFRSPTIYYARALIETLALNSYPYDLMLYCDYHGHSLKKFSFIYGCNNDDDENFYMHERVFPSLVQRRLPSLFSFDNCSFKVQASKARTARISLYRDLNLINCFTCETTYSGTPNGSISRRDHEWIGRGFCESLLLYTCENVWTGLKKQLQSGKASSSIFDGLADSGSESESDSAGGSEEDHRPDEHVGKSKKGKKGVKKKGKFRRAVDGRPPMARRGKK